MATSQPHIPPVPSYTSRFAERHRTTERPSASDRFGYLVAIAVNVAMVYVAHHLLEWGWPYFLTPAFDQVLPIITISLIAGIVANVLFLGYDAGWFKSLVNVITLGIAFLATWRVYQVFPFDFSGSERDWSTLLHVALVLAMVGTAIGMLVELVNFLIWPRRRTPEGDV